MIASAGRGETDFHEDDLFGDARWIWPESYHWDLHNCYALFRREFVLREVPSAARFLITADQSYQLHINGRYVCRGPARGYQSHWPYDDLDVAAYLEPGRNVIAIRAYNPGFGNFQYLSQGFAGLLVAARFGDRPFVSDASWKARRQHGINPSAVPVSVQLCPQEHIDLREESPEWAAREFDDRDWLAPVANHCRDAMPWDRLEQRGIPQLEERFVAPPRLIGRAAGRSGEGYVATRDVVRFRLAEGVAHLRCEEEGGVLEVTPSDPDGFASYLLDFGATVIGSMGFRIDGASGGEVIDVLYGETIDERSLAVQCRPDRGSRMAFGSRLVCAAGGQEHVFYHAYGFRYVVVTVRGASAPLTVYPFVRSALYPLERRAVFETSDLLLGEIWKICAWTQRVCSLDAFVDTPGREQVQWWGDAQVQAKNTFFYSGDTRLFRRGLAQIAAQTAPNGLTYGHAPTMAHSCILPDYTLIWFVTFWDYYWQTGSLEPFLTHQSTIWRALEYFERQTDEETGLAGYDERYWLFLDWCDLFKDGYPAVYNLWLLIALERLTELCWLNHDEPRAIRLSVWSGQLRQALRRLIDTQGLVHDGLTREGLVVPRASVHTQTLAIMAGLDPERDPERLEKSILPYIRREEEPENSPSCYWVNYVFEVLTRAGYGAEVVAFIREKWEPMVAHGTTWEVFDPKPGEESFSHAWSAHPLYHLMQILGGIRQTGAQWERVVFEPCFIGEHASVRVPTPRGPIDVAWKRAGAVVTVDLDLPEGVLADVSLPGLGNFEVRGAGKWEIGQERPELVSCV